LKRKYSLCTTLAMLAMLVGMMGAGCRESNPAYVRTVDAARERPSATGADLAAPADRVRADAESADRALPNLDGRSAEVATDKSVADVSPDEGADLPDASADGTVGDDSLSESRDVRIAGDTVDSSSDAPLGIGDVAGAGLDTNLDRSVDVAVSMDVEGDLNPDAEGDAGVDVDAGD
jgi:hypothetical protein